MAGGSTERMHIEIKPLRPLLSLLRGNALYAEPWRGALDKIGLLSEQFAIRGAPMGETGKLIARMSYRVQAIAVPLYVVIKTAAPRPRGYGYPPRQEFDPKMGNLDWFIKAIESGTSAWSGLLNRAASEIENRWARLN